MGSDNNPLSGDNRIVSEAASLSAPQLDVNSTLELDKAGQESKDATEQITDFRAQQQSWRRRLLAAAMIVAGLVAMGAIADHVAQQQNITTLNASQPDVSKTYKVQSISLPGLSRQLGGNSLTQAHSLQINGLLDVNDSLVLRPIPKPSAAVTGQVYFDENRKQLAYFNGSQFVYLQTPIPGVTSVGGATGAIALAAGLAESGSTLSNTGVLAIGGQSGSITLGNGLAISNGKLFTTDIRSVVSASSNLTVTNDGNGNLTITDTDSSGAGGGTVSSPGGTSGHIAEFSGSQTIADSILTQSGTTVTVAGTLGATALSGNGSGVTNVDAATLSGNTSNFFTNATNISSGTLANARLSSNVTLQGNTFNAANELVQLNATGGLPTLNASLLTNLDASNLASGTVSDARLSTNVALLSSSNNFTGITLQHNGNDVCDNSNNCGYLTGSAANGSYIELQSSTPGTAQTGHFNITGTGTAGSLKATTVYQNGNQVCDTSGNCAGIGGDVTGSGTTNTIAMFTNTGAIGNSIITQSGTTVTVAGTLSATSLTGNGSGVTNVDAATLGGNASGYFTNATNIASGTLSDSRLSANVTLQGNTFNGANELLQLNATDGLPALDGSLLMNLNASNISSGTLADARLSSNVPLLNGSDNFTGITLQHNGNSLCDSSNNCAYLSDSASAGGDLTGNYPNPTIAKIQGSTVTITSPAAGQVLNYNGTAWANTGSPTVSGLLTVQGGATITGGALTFTGSAASSLTTTSGTLTLTSAAAATWSTTAGNLTLQAGSGIISLGSTTTLAANGGLTISSGGASNLALDTSSSLANIVIGGTNAGTIQLGSTTSSATQTINIGTNATAGSTTNITIGSSIGSSTTTVQGGTGLSAVDIESNGGFITIGGNNTSQFIDIGYGGNGANTVNLGDSNSNVSIESGSSNTYIQNSSPILGTVIQSLSNSYSAFQIENASSLAVLNFDTTTNILTLGNITTTSGDAIAGTVELADGTIDGYGATLNTSTLTANQTISLPNASGILCLDSGNCSTAGSGYILNQSTTPGTVQNGNFNINGTGTIGTELSTPLVDTSGALSLGTGTATGVTLGRSSINTNVTGSNVFITGNTSILSGGTFNVQSGYATITGFNTANANPTLTVNSHGSGASPLVVQSADTTVFTIANGGAATFENSTNSTTAFQVQNASGTSMYNINTNNVLINDNLTTASPTGTFVNGASWVSGQYVELDNGGPGVDGEINYTEPNVGNSFDATFDFWSLSGGSDGTWFYAYDTQTPSSYHFGNPNGGYDFAYSDQNSDVELYFNGTLLASAPISAPNNSTWHTAEVKKAGDTMTMYYDGSSVLTYTDSVVRALTGTNFGLGGCSCSASGEHRATNFMLTSDASTTDTFSQFSTGINVSGGATASNVNVAADDNATNNALNVSDNGLTTGNAVSIASNSAAQTAGSLLNVSDTATLTTSGGSMSGSLVNISRSLQANIGSAGSETVTSAVASFSNNCTLTSGSCTDATNVLSLNQQYTNATGAVLSIQNAGTGDMVDVMNGSSVVVDKFGNDGSLYIGQSGGSTTPSYLVLGSKTTSADPALITDGAMYYNTSTKSFRCQTNGHWDSCTGLVSANTTPSSAITNTTTSTAFSGGNGSTYTIPANDCQPGVTYLITARGWYDTTGSPTITWNLDFGTTTLMATGAMPTMSNTVGEAGWKLSATLICDTTGASGTVEAQGDVTQLTSSTSGLPGYGIDADTGMMSDTSAQTINTTVSNTIKIYAQWSAASTSNKVELRQLVVQRLGPS